MGQTDSKDSTKLQNLYQQYQTIQTFDENNKFGECKLLQSKKNPTQIVLLKEINLTDEQQFNKIHRKYESRSKLDHPNIINVTNHFYILEQQLCGQFYKVYVVFEYFKNTLGDLIEQGIKEPELWSLLTGTIYGLAYLQQNSIHHDCLSIENIFVNPDEMTVKVADPGYFTQINMFTQILQDTSQTSNKYLSPILLKAIHQNNWQPKHNTYKSDVFSLGMIIIHAALNQSCDDCYKYENGIILEDVLRQKMYLLQSCFSDQFTCLVNSMIQLQEDKRPDFIQLSMNLKTHQTSTQNSSSQSNDSLQEQSFSSNMQSQQKIKRKIPYSQYPNPEKTNYFHQDAPLVQQIQQTPTINEPTQEKFNYLNQTDSSIVDPIISSTKHSSQQTKHKISYSQQSIPEESLSKRAQQEQQTLQSFPLNDLSQENLRQFNYQQQAHQVEDQISKIIQSNNYRQEQQNENIDKVGPNNFILKPQGFGTSWKEPSKPQSSIGGISSNKNSNQENFTNYKQPLPFSQQSLLQRDTADTIAIHQNLDLPTKYNPNDENADPSGQSQDDDILKSTTQHQNMFKLSTAQEFKPLQDYTNIFQKHQLTKTGQQPYQNGQTTFEDYENKQHLNYTIQYPTQENTIRVQNSYAYNQNSNKNKDTFAVPFDLPSNPHAYNVKCADYDDNHDFNLTSYKQENNEVRKLNFHQPSENVRRSDQKFNHDISRQYNQRSFQEQEQNIFPPSQYPFDEIKGNQLTHPNSLQSITRNQQIKAPHYVVEHYQNGSRYEGDKFDGQRHGQGKFFYQDGGLYDGGWDHNKMHGRGVLFYASGKPAYDGEWMEDKFQGFGNLQNECPIKSLQEFDYRDFDYVEEYWIKYQGDFHDDNKEGQGTLFLSNGERFVGSFSKDYINGTGLFYCLNGKVINGRWCNNKLIS